MLYLARQSADQKGNANITTKDTKNTNVFALAVKRDPEIADFNPLMLWDLHHLKEIDDSGYINRLYQ